MRRIWIRILNRKPWLSRYKPRYLVVDIHSDLTALNIQVLPLFKAHFGSNASVCPEIGRSWLNQKEEHICSGLLDHCECWQLDIVLIEWLESLIAIWLQSCMYLSVFGWRQLLRDQYCYWCTTNLSSLLSALMIPSFIFKRGSKLPGTW